MSRTSASDPFARFEGRVLGVATQHGKERVIAPAFMRSLPLSGVKAIVGVDTDRFGTFSGDVQRVNDPSTTALAKAKHGADLSGLDLVIASEGSFAPYPPAPFLSCNEELLLLYDARDEATFEHRHVSLDTVFGEEKCGSIREVMQFVERMKFPEHGVILRPREHWTPGDAVHKGIHDPALLIKQAEAMLNFHGSVLVGTDMRAMSNPTRMRVIEEATGHFVKELTTTCPQCNAMHFRITGTEPGLPCALCGSPTASIRAHVRTCTTCGCSEQQLRQDGKHEEDPRFCDHCNP